MCQSFNRGLAFGYILGGCLRTDQRKRNLLVQAHLRSLGGIIEINSIYTYYFSGEWAILAAGFTT